MGRHSLEEHTGEVELRVEAPSLAELFGEAARALAEIMGGPLRAAEGAPRQVHLQAPDRDALLVDWMNELVFLSERDKRIFGEVRIEEVSDHELRASVRGWEAGDLRLQVKAATFHGLDVREGPEGFSANLVLDV